MVCVLFSWVLGFGLILVGLVVLFDLGFERVFFVLVMFVVCAVSVLFVVF